jgi:uncharacterized damage-inducible protein DinB
MNERNAAAVSTVSHAAALAHYAGQEGQINLHKLLEAAIFSIVRAAAYGARATTTFASLPAVLADLRTLGTEPALLDALAAVQTAISAGEVPLIDTAPDAYVCRVCGNTTLGAAPAACPTCDASPHSFRRFRGIFNVDNPDPLASLDILAQTPAAVADLLEGLDEDALTAEPAPGAWSLRRSLQHLLDTQNLLAGRLDLMLTADDPRLAMEPTWARAAAAQDTAAMLDEFRRKRAATVTQLEALPLRTWGRTGQHTEFGRVTILQQVGYFAYHDAFHLPDFMRKRRQLGGEPQVRA